MSSTFYKSIIEDEINAFGIKEESLKVASNLVGKTYSKHSLRIGQTFLDYNLPSNRCAYLYKYASIHTELVTKFFRKLMRKKEVKSILHKKGRLKICCLGGGPGTDAVGLFKALALNPHYNNKIVEVTILDICGGWRNSFKRIMKNVVEGKVKGIPETFVDIDNFKFKLIEVNLLNSLPASVSVVLSEADIICMVKFISAILGSATSVSALEIIGGNLKVGTIVFFIDNFNGNVFKPITDIAEDIGLKIVIGPLHEQFNNKAGFIKSTSTEKKIFGCLPLFGTKITVLGFIKSNESIETGTNKRIKRLENEIVVDDNDESLESSSKQNFQSKNVSQASCDKFTQTCDKYFQINNNYVAFDSSIKSNQSKLLGSLCDSLFDLVLVLNEWQENFRVRRHCWHCS